MHYTGNSHKKSIIRACTYWGYPAPSKRNEKVLIEALATLRLVVVVDLVSLFFPLLFFWFVTIYLNSGFFLFSPYYCTTYYYLAFSVFSLIMKI
jgi:hypothetical protein